ncbi:membrane-bound lytic murein transglycosylase F [Abditibacteriota bacterium]|nr:membrane-bound lytic murein transglycosylase F [Abditibacteriota bacterium]
MRLPLLLSLLAATSAPGWAQTTPAPSPPTSAALPDFETQKKTLEAARIDTIDELHDQGNALVGKTVELRGVVKGIFGGGQALSILLELPDGQTQVVAATPSFKTSPAGRAGTWVRLLCHVQGTVGIDTILQLINVTSQRDAVLFDGPNDDTSAVLDLPQNVPGAPPPSDVIVNPSSIDGVIIGPEVDLPPAPPSAATRSAPVTIAPRPQTRQATPRANAFYGFDDSSRAAFRSLAMRNNPRLDSDSADNIADCLLEAAKAQSLDPRFLAAIVQVESQFNPYAVSGAGAMGLGQLMPFNLRPLGVANAWDPRQNLHGAAKLLRQNLNVYARDNNGTMLAVAAYHAGVGAVNRAGRAIPKATTQKYVWKVYYAYRALAPELFR